MTTKPATHTPGPWSVEESDPYIYIETELFGDPPGGIAPGTYTVALLRDGFPVSSPDVVRANARLIAAAPELLEALERIANHEYRSDRRARGMVDVDEIESLKRTARAAIAKAKGE